MVILSIPIPKAKPEYTSGFSPTFFNTFGWTIPHPIISNQPFFPNISTSTEGSVNGKYEGRNLTLGLSLKKDSTNSKI